MKHSSANDYLIMFFIMILSALLSTMNVWVDKYQDIRFSINDVYMAFLMGGWMLLFMGLLNKDPEILLLGFLIVIINIGFIRSQFLVTEEQYKLGMIPHHSMAVHMSKKLLEKNNNIPDFLKNVITAQESEIQFMKNNKKNNIKYLQHI